MVRCFLLALLFCAAPLLAADARPNVVIILADDLGYGDLASYGATLIDTPHTDRLAREGRRFTDAHSPAAVCSPTRFGLMTGTYPWREGRVPRHLHAWEPLVIRDGEPTIASILKSAGYATACIGKWHLGAQRQDSIDWDKPLTPGPRHVGFDYYFGVINSHNQAPFVWVENETILDREAGETITIKGNNTQTSGRETRDSFEGERMLAEHALRFIDEAARGDRPFFLYYPASAVHLPITPGKHMQGKSRAGAYGDYVQEFDWEVGQVLAALDRNKVADNTLVIVSSDNGARGQAARGFEHRPNGSLRGDKGTVFEGGHRVPFIVRWPEHVPAGTISDQTLSLVDMMATICAATGVEKPSNAGPDSHNVLPALLGDDYKKPLRDSVIAVSQHVAQFSYRRGPWKLIVPSKGKDEAQLYHLGDDPAEAHNLAATKPELVEELTHELNQARNR